MIRAPRGLMGRRGTGLTNVNNNLTPEEDTIGDPGEDNDEIDDTLPADLWFRTRFADDTSPHLARPVHKAHRRALLD
jgi:hypothetical protein